MPKSAYIKMRARLKCALSFINILLLFLDEAHGLSKSVSNAAYVQGIKRTRRQAGYVYDRPNVPFNLPSQNVAISSSTQASPVDRTVMQMYYAYPVPAEGVAVNVGFPTNTGSTVSPTPAASGANGYNYNSPEAAIVPKTEVGTQEISGPSSSAGYNYNAQTVVVAGSGGGGSSQATGTMTAPNSVDTSGSTGYSYGVQKSEVSQGSAQGNSILTNAAIENSSSFSANFDGYNYGIQNNGAGNIQLANTGGSIGYTVQTIATPAPLATGSISSTRAPEYLPPATNIQTSFSSNVNLPSSVPIATPSGSYLPPSVSSKPAQIFTATQATPTVQPSVSVLPQTSNAVVTAPQTSYLQPNIFPTMSNPNQPSINSGQTGPTGETQFVPSMKYLPPIISTNGEVNQYVSTPAATYLPPVL